MQNEKKNNSLVYEIITKRILDMMIDGNIPWRQTWFAKKGEKAKFTNYVTGRPYSSFLNCLLLGEPGEYLTKKQIEDQKGIIKKGSHGKIVIFWGEFIPEKNKEKAEQLKAEGKPYEHLKIKFPKYYRVYNAKDVMGLKERKKKEDDFVTQEAEDPVDIANIVMADYSRKENVKVDENANNSPAYDWRNDTVKVPLKEFFKLEEDWYASVFDGMVHSTSTPERCNRKKEYEKIEEDDMSVKEELIGEMASSMILTACGLERKATHQQIAAECQKWVEAMNNDYKLIVNSSYAAEKAANYILGQFAEKAEQEETENASEEIIDL